MEGPVQLESCNIVGDAVLASHVEHALSLRLPELRGFEYPWAETLRIVANGPSALAAPLDGKTLALNGALRLFTERGLAPTYWAACDPQALVADFLLDAPESTVYLVCSRCHPAVFEALRDRTVILWHIDDLATWARLEQLRPVATACSVTICAFELMERLGFRRFETWGWDGCLVGDAENAVPQFNGYQHIDVDVRGRRFTSTTTWALEAQDARNKLLSMRDRIDVRGDGMFAAILGLDPVAA